MVFCRLLSVSQLYRPYLVLGLLRVGGVSIWVLGVKSLDVTRV